MIENDDDYRRIYVFFACLFFFYPLLLFWAWILFTHSHFSHFVPILNDEVGWYLQIKDVIRNGKPLGYFGYNETHAPIGTFGPWGAAIIYVMSIIPRFVGWRPWSPMIVNVLTWVIANMFFFFYTKPTKRALIRLILCQFTLFVNVNYLFIAMSEITRYSMSIYLIGLFYYLMFSKDKKSNIYQINLFCIAPIVLLVSIMAYIMFALYAFVYGYILYKKYFEIFMTHYPKYRKTYSVFSLCIFPIIFAAVCYKFTIATTAPYLTNGVIGAYLNCESLPAMIRLFIGHGNLVMKGCSLSAIIQNASYSCGCISSFLLFYYALTILAVVNLLYCVKSKKDRNTVEYCVLIAIQLIIFMFAFIYLYEAGARSWTFVRGINVGLNAAIYLIALGDSKNGIESKKITLFSNRNIFVIIIFSSLICLIPYSVAVNSRLKSFETTRFNYQVFDKYEKVFAEHLKSTKTKNPYDNTVAHYEGVIHNFYAAIPDGVSTNWISNYGYNVKKSKYIIMPTGRQRLTDGYEEIYYDDNIYIYKKKK